MSEEVRYHLWNLPYPLEPTIAARDLCPGCGLGHYNPEDVCDDPDCREAHIVLRLERA